MRAAASSPIGRQCLWSLLRAAWLMIVLMTEWHLR